MYIENFWRKRNPFGSTSTMHALLPDALSPNFNNDNEVNPQIDLAHSYNKSKPHLLTRLFPRRKDNSLKNLAPSISTMVKPISTLRTNASCCLSTSSLLAWLPQHQVPQGQVRQPFLSRRARLTQMQTGPLLLINSRYQSSHI